MSQFDFDIKYVKGEYNKVADCLSRYLESDISADMHEFHDHVHANQRVDPEEEDLPLDQLQEIKERHVELHLMHAMTTGKVQKLHETREEREEQAAATL